jgi:hypothetical protein
VARKCLADCRKESSSVPTNRNPNIESGPADRNKPWPNNTQRKKVQNSESDLHFGALYVFFTVLSLFRFSCFGFRV